MSTNILKTTLKKQIGSVIYDLMIKTSTAMVYLDDGTTLESKLTQILNDVQQAKSDISTLIGDDAAGSITEKIETAINEAVTALKNESDSSSLGGKIKAINNEISKINNATTGILAKSKEYTDTVKESIVSELSGAFHFKGKVDYIADLPNNAEAGDLYQVKYKGASPSTTPYDAEYCWNGTEYVELGSIVDLSNYFTSSEVTSKINTAKSGAISTAKTYTNTEIEKVNTNLNNKCRIYVSETQPANLTESDLWFQTVTN